jgi:23S rRNA pseudouridine955/2504/2580 synthase
MKKNSLSLTELIVYEDDTLLALNKPAGWATLAERNQPGTGLLDLVRETYPDIRVCHRLDKQTTGILLFAKTAEAYRDIAIQFEGRQVEKHYHALIHGSHALEGLLVEAPIHTDDGVSRVDFQQGKASATLIQTHTAWRHFTLLDCQPFTGRAHQIRVHLAYIQCPIVGDALYGGDNILLSTLKRNYKPDREQEERPLNKGFLLHSVSLGFTHPATGEPCKVEAPLNDNFDMCVGKLDKYDRL